MMIVDNKQIGFIYKNNKSIDKIFKEGEVVFERGFLREKTSTTLPITFGGVGKDLKDYRVYGNTYQNTTSGKNLYTINSMKSKSATVIIVGETLNISYDNTNGSSTKYNEFHTTLSSLIKENETYSIVCEILEISGTGTLRLNSPNSNVNESQFTLASAYSISDLTQGQILIENVTALNSFENATRCVRSNIRVNVGQSCNAKLRISLIKGTVNPNDFVYEPYTGGQPSPNPEYPQKIISCGDNETGLPLGYTQVDYIKTTGIQYIDTRYYGNLNTEIQAKATTIMSSGRQLLGDITDSSKAISCNISLNSSPTSRFGSKSGSVNFSNYISADTPFNLKENKNGIYVNNTQVIEFNETTDFTTENTLILLNRNSSTGTSQYGLDGKLYYCKIYDNNVLVRDFIPCYRNSDNEVGLYDLVNNVFYTNQGTGSFTYGNVVAKGGYKIPVNVRSDNLFKAPESIPNSQRNLATYTKINDNSFSLNYTQTNSTNRSPFARIDFDVTKFKPNTQYTISKKNTTTGTSFSNAGAIRTYINGVNGTVENSDTLTFTTPSEITSLGIYFYLGYENTTEGESTITFYDIQIVEGSTVPSKYIPYYNETTNIYLSEPLRKIGGYTDYIDFKNSKVVRNIGKKMIDGSLYWVTSQFASGKRIYTLATTNIDSNIRGVLENTDKALIVADRYKTESIEDILAVTKKYAIGLSKTNYLSIQNQDYTYSTDLIQSLTDNPVELCYALSTPTEETITLPNIPTIDGNNTLNIETELTPSQVYIKYKSNE